MNATPYMLVTTRLEAQGFKLRTLRPRRADIVRACRTDCPSCGAHAHPLEVAERSEDDAVLLCCHQGCRVDAITAALGLEVSELFPHRSPTAERVARTAGPSAYWDTATAEADAALEAVYRALRGDVSALQAARTNLIDLHGHIVAAIRADEAAAKKAARIVDHMIQRTGGLRLTA